MTKNFTIGLDLDGVTGDYHAGFASRVARYLGVNEDTLPAQTAWSYADCWGISVDEYNRLHNRAVEDGLFSDMAVIDGAAETLQRLSAEGVKIRVVTHRLMVKGNNAKVITDTVNWLETANIPFDDLCMMGAKEELNASTFIDDAPHNITKLRRAGRTAITFDHLYNRNVDGLRAHGWNDVYNIVTQMRDIAA